MISYLKALEQSSILSLQISSLEPKINEFLGNLYFFFKKAGYIRDTKYTNQLVFNSTFYKMSIPYYRLMGWAVADLIVPSQFSKASGKGIIFLPANDTVMKNNQLCFKNLSARNYFIHSLHEVNKVFKNEQTFNDFEKVLK